MTSPWSHSQDEMQRACWRGRQRPVSSPASRAARGSETPAPGMYRPPAHPFPRWRPAPGRALRHHQHQRGGQPAATTSGIPSTPRNWAASIGRYSHPGSPLTAWNTARSAGLTRPSATITAQTANTARLAASTIRSRRMRRPAPGPPAVPARLATQDQPADGRSGKVLIGPPSRRVLSQQAAQRPPSRQPAAPVSHGKTHTQSMLALVAISRPGTKPCQVRAGDRNVNGARIRLRPSKAAGSVLWTTSS